MRQRHRLSKFLLRRDLRCPTDRPWTQRWMRWLAALNFDESAAQLTFADYVACVEAATQRRSLLDQAIERSWPDSPFAPVIARLRCFRGLDTLSAAGLAAEIGDFERFTRPRHLAAPDLVHDLARLLRSSSGVLLSLRIFWAVRPLAYEPLLEPP
jgi:hypothetical protein